MIRLQIRDRWADILDQHPECEPARTVVAEVQPHPFDLTAPDGDTYYHGIAAFKNANIEKVGVPTKVWLNDGAGPVDGMGSVGVSCFYEVSPDQGDVSCSSDAAFDMSTLSDARDMWLSCFLNALLEQDST